MKILIAEDDFFSYKFLQKMLESEGHRVFIAEDGLKAWGLVQKEGIKMVITDWMMPGMDGLQLCRTIRENQTLGYVFIILLTTRDSKGDIISGLDAGADDYLSKPFNRSELMARLKTGMRILHLEKSLQAANEAIKKLSIIDPLTQSYNRGHIAEQLPKEIKRSERYRFPVSLILCDIDHFKKINDSYGHKAGDRVLVEFVQSIIESIRDGVDWVARYGGEEFLIVLPEADLNCGRAVAERLRESISKRVITVDDTIIRITASYGVTGFDAGGATGDLTPEDLINDADRHLYRAKREGRNRVVAGIYNPSARLS